MANKPEPGQRLADITIPELGGGEPRLGITVDDHDKHRPTGSGRGDHVDNHHH